MQKSPHRIAREYRLAVERYRNLVRWCWIAAIPTLLLMLFCGPVARALAVDSSYPVAAGLVLLISISVFVGYVPQKLVCCPGCAEPVGSFKEVTSRQGTKHLLFKPALNCDRCPRCQVVLQHYLVSECTCECGAVVKEGLRICPQCNANVWTQG